MEQSTMEVEYVQDFAKFLAHNNEKSLLLERLRTIIRQVKPRSMLDVGAGEGELAIPLSREVRYYLAVEKRRAHAAKLMGAGIIVAEESYPVKINSRFDLILMSHVLGLRQEHWESYLTHAWPILNPGGELVIITFRGEETDWTRLMRAIGQELLPEHQECYAALTSYLAKLGELGVEILETALETETLDDMFHALCFVAGDGKSERKRPFMQNRATVEHILNKQYRTDIGYRFPFIHYILRTKKL